ncbi:MAG: M48 family metallopeptidase [Silicimonas sp.]|nr:M48 family metallopeptidase [Silicimonas sp.]
MQISLGENEAVEVHMRRSSRARRLSLRVSQLDGKVTLTLPDFTPTREARAFLDAHVEWIRRALENQKPVVPVQIGAEIPVEGHMRRIKPGQGRSARLLPDHIMAPEARVGPAVEALLKTLARDRLTTATASYAAELGRDFQRITLRDTRSRWGSCSHAGNLMYSWRLILAPPEVLDYVAAHEVAHLEYMDHSEAFWTVVGHLCPDYQAPKLWLRREGAALHGYRFSSND